MPLIRIKEDLFTELEKRMHFRFWRKERDRIDHAVQMGKAGPTHPYCPHLRTAYSGPPWAGVEAITCLDCQGFVTAPEMEDRGYKFDECPDWVYFQMMNEKNERILVRGNPTPFFVS